MKTGLISISFRLSTATMINYYKEGNKSTYFSIRYVQQFMQIVLKEKKFSQMMFGFGGVRVSGGVCFSFFFLSFFAFCNLCGVKCIRVVPVVVPEDIDFRPHQHQKNSTSIRLAWRDKKERAKLGKDVRECGVIFFISAHFFFLFH